MKTMSWRAMVMLALAACGSEEEEGSARSVRRDACEPATCTEAGAECGSIDDGCGGTRSCGACAAPLTCGGGGVANQCGGVGWSEVPTDVTDDLRAVWLTPSGVLWAVGDYGTIVASTTVGITVYGYADSPLYALWGSSDDDIYAAGDNTLLHWDGATWSYEESPTTGTILGMWGVGDDLWVVGEYVGAGNARRRHAGYWEYGGASNETGAQQTLRAVWGRSVNDVWAVGAEGVFRWDGSAWEKLYLDASVYSVYGTASAGPWIGSEALRLYSYAPSSWGDWMVGEPYGLVYLEAFYGVWGSSGSNAWAVGSSGYMARYYGGDWQPVEAVTDRDLFAIGGNGSEMWAVGESGVVLRYGSIQ